MTPECRSIVNAVSVGMLYEIEKANLKAARAQYNYAAEAMEIALIRQRLAEINYQSEPLSSLLNKPMSERERLYAAAYYVVVGRMPQEEGES